MSAIEHRNVIKKKFCPTCDHFNGVERSNVPGATGMCLKEPPEVFVVGMAQTTASAIKAGPPEMIPVLRSYYPPVGPTDTCAQWTARPEGEA